MARPLHLAFVVSKDVMPGLRASKAELVRSQTHNLAILEMHLFRVLVQIPSELPVILRRTLVEKRGKVHLVHTHGRRVILQYHGPGILARGWK